MTSVLRLVTDGGASAVCEEEGSCDAIWVVLRLRKKESKMDMRRERLNSSRSGEIRREVDLIANREIQHVVGTDRHCSHGSALEWIGFPCIARHLVLEL